jgi:hypothetical protein
VAEQPSGVVAQHVDVAMTVSVIQP